MKVNGTAVIRRCNGSDFETIYEIINDAAVAYRSVIPTDHWHEPYMSSDELSREISDGVIFWGAEQNGQLNGVMGIQDKADVTLIRHAYVRTGIQKQGIGTQLLHHFEKSVEKPILIGTKAEKVNDLVISSFGFAMSWFLPFRL
jgi:GNAT superfamily N-acetyltransferase